MERSAPRGPRVDGSAHLAWIGAVPLGFLGALHAISATLSKVSGAETTSRLSAPLWWLAAALLIVPWFLHARWALERGLELRWIGASEFPHARISLAFLYVSGIALLVYVPWHWMQLHPSAAASERGSSNPWGHALGCLAYFHHLGEGFRRSAARTGLFVGTEARRRGRFAGHVIQALGILLAITLVFHHHLVEGGRTR